MLTWLFNIAILNGLTPPEDIMKGHDFEKILSFVPILLSIGVLICIFFVIKDCKKQNKPRDEKTNKTKNEEEHK